MEQAEGTRLYECGGRPLRLSKTGRLLLPHARRILDDVAEAGAALEGISGKSRGKLRINAAMTYALGIVAPMLPDFSRRYPDLRVVLETEKMIVDVAIRSGALPNSDLVARKLGRIELWPSVSPDYLARHGTPRGPDEFSQHVLLGWQDRPGTWRFIDAAAGEHLVDVPSGTVASEPAILQILLLEGVGIGRLPDFLARPPIRAGRLCRLLPDYRTDTTDAHAVLPTHRSLSAKVRLFVDALVASLAAGGSTAG